MDKEWLGVSQLLYGTRDRQMDPILQGIAYDLSLLGRAEKKNNNKTLYKIVLTLGLLINRKRIRLEHRRINWSY